MKKKINSLVWLILITAIFIPIRTGAEESKKKCTKFSITKTSVLANIEGIHRGYLYTITKGNTKGLCLDPGLRASNKFQYGTSTKGNNKHIGQALNYLQQGGDTLAAQVVAWLPDASYEEWVKAYKKAKFQTGGLWEAEYARQEISKILNTGYVQYCEYTTSESGAQRIAVPGENCDDPCDPPGGEDNKCPEYEIATDSTTGACKDDAEVSTHYFSEYSYFKGTYSKYVQNKNKYGKLAIQIPNNDYCKIYCLEEATVLLPGAPNEIEMGQATLTWPTSNDKVNNNQEGANKYPLAFRGKKVCHISIASNTNACTYDDIVKKYGEFYDAVHAGPKLTYAPCIVNSWKSKSCAETGKQVKLNSIRTSSTCSKGNHNDNISCGEEYYKDTYKYEDLSKYSKKATTEYNEAKKIYDAALKTCKGKTHTDRQSCTKGSSGCTCDKNGKNCKKDVSIQNDETYCNATSSANGGVASEKATMDEYAEYNKFLLGELGKADENIKQVKDFISTYYNAEKILSALRECEKYDFSNNASTIYTTVAGEEGPTSFKSGATVLYHKDNSDDPDEYKLITESDTSYRCDSGCDATNHFQNKELDNVKTLNDLYSVDELEKSIQGLMDREVTLSTGDIIYKLDDNAGAGYIEISSGKITNTKPSQDTEDLYKKLDKPNIPLGDDINKNEYKLELIFEKFGTMEQFSYDNQKYVCYSEPGLPDSCDCPPGTNHYGVDIRYKMVEENITCADAIEKYCKKDKITYACPDLTHETEVTECVGEPYKQEKYEACIEEICSYRPACPDGSRSDDMLSCIGDNYVDNYEPCRLLLCSCEECYKCTMKDENGQNKTIILDTCVTENLKRYNGDTDKAYKYCKNKHCPPSGKRFECPDNTPNYKMDITDCVEEYLIKNGHSFNSDEKYIKAALQYCVDVVCPYDGLKIIYRTIKLENPFPSYNADATKLSSLKKGTFNLDVSGRYPGTNWNSKLLVYNQIINNRGTQYRSEQQLNNSLGKVSLVGTTLYQTEDPLYVFRLTPKVINDIRGYNKQQSNQDDGYADFTLDCKNGIACISPFVHGNIKSVGSFITGGTCQNATSKDAFNSCAED